MYPIINSDDTPKKREVYGEQVKEVPSTNELPMIQPKKCIEELTKYETEPYFDYTQGLGNQ